MATIKGMGKAHNAKQKAVAKKPALTKQNKASKRPEVNATISVSNVQTLINNMEAIKELVEGYAAHMRALDRKRLNGVGVKKQGFITKSLELANENQEFLPHWLPINKFTLDVRLFSVLRTLFDMNRQIGEIIWNLVMQASDMAYTDALEFYSSVREAAKRRVDAAETLFEILKPFFSREKMSGDEPTEAELLRDFNAMLHGKKDGKIMLENISPKVIKGKKKVIDETYKDKAAFKETDSGEVED